MIRAIINHPDHNLATHDNDISIVKLKTPLTFNNNVTRACLPEPSFTPQTQAVVSGWGNTVHGMCTLESAQDLCKMDIKPVFTIQCNLNLVSLNLVTTYNYVAIFKRPFFNLLQKSILLVTLDMHFTTNLFYLQLWLPVDCVFSIL